MGRLDQKRDADVMELANSDTNANVHNVQLFEACGVCGKFNDKHAENLPMLCSECFHECRTKAFYNPIGDIGLFNYLYNHSHPD